MNQNALFTRVNDLLNVLFLNHRFALKHNFNTFNRNYFTGILINEVFERTLQHTGSQLAADNILQIRFVHLDFLGELENLQNVLIRVITDSTQQSSYGQLFLTVDVSIHHIVDVRSKFDPRTLERDDTCRIKLRTVSVDA